MRTTLPSAAIICGVIRPLRPVAAAVAALALAVGCGGDESEVCSSLQDLQGSVQSLQDIELDDTSVEELDEAANQVLTDANEAQAVVDEELGQEIDTFKATVDDVIAQVEAASAQDELTSESLAAIGASVSTAVTAYETLEAAAPDDCDLQ